MRHSNALLCLTMIVVTTTANSVNRGKRRSVRTPDVDEFLDKLLSSDKFEKLADRIAEKAADKILAIQTGSKRHNHKVATDITAENDRVQNKIHAYYRQKANTINETSASDESTATTQNKENVTTKGKKKLQSFAVVETFSDQGANNLSLKFKHFTTTSLKEVSKMTTLKMQLHKKTHEKTVEANSKEIVTKPDNIDEGSALTAETREKKNSKGHPVSMEKEAKRNIDPEVIIQGIKNTKLTAEENSLSKSALGSQSRSEEATETGSSSDSDAENIYAQKSPVLSTITPKQKSKKLARTGDLRESESSKIDSEYIDKTTAALERDHEDKSDKSSEDASNENLLAESGNYDNKDLAGMRANDDGRAYEKRPNYKTPSETTEQKVPEDKDPIDKIDLKHKVREQNGKLYAFAQHPDYEEYHQQVKEILRSVQDNKTIVRRSDVNLDLLDLVE